MTMKHIQAIKYNSDIHVPYDPHNDFGYLKRITAVNTKIKHGAFILLMKVCYWIINIDKTNQMKN